MMLSKQFSQKHSGLVALEFAALLPAYLAIIFGIVQLSLYFYTQQALTVAAFQAARYLAVNQLDSCYNLNNLVKTQVINHYLKGYAINPNVVTVGVHISTHCNCVGNPIVVKVESNSSLMGIDAFRPFGISVFRKEGVIGSEC